MEDTFTIIEGCRARDHRYQKILYERYYAFGLKTVFRYIYNYEEAVEVCNDGFVKFFLNIDNFKYVDVADINKLLNGWLKRILVNTAIDLLRKKMLLPEIGGIPEYLWETKDKSASADQKAIYKDLIKLVKKLPPSLRIVFNMHVIDGYTHFEIAEILAIPIGTSKSYLHRAKSLMQKYLNQEEVKNQCSM